MTFSALAVLILFPAIMTWAAVSDLLSMTISNRITLLLVVSFAFCAVLFGLSWSAIGWHLGAGMLVLSISFGFFAAGWIGGGDAKLAAATALWFGFEPLFPYLVIAAFAGTGLTFAILQLRANPLPSFAAKWPWLARLHDDRNGVPYGIALAFAALIVLPDTNVWRAAIGV
ncbi:MAG: A24 family peptidase [Bosea sp. (in: a-proteobacteria)]